MDAAPHVGALDFEVYLLVSMKYGMINRDAVREAKLAERGLSVGDAEHIHLRVAEQLANRSTQFENLRTLVGAEAPEIGSLTFRGILWPDFDFTATANHDGSIDSAGYRRARGHALVVGSPTEQPPWSMDAADFTHNFGPVTIGYSSGLFEEMLPAHKGLDFDWNGRKYRAAFSWGLFLSASLVWT
ncbi:hypothetical protein OKHIL_12010 [Mycolicibacterium mageritense]|nr:hypothetical protein MTY414_14930 [Mycolicibacterium mageritense]